MGPQLLYEPRPALNRGSEGSGSGSLNYGLKELKDYLFRYLKIELIVQTVQNCTLYGLG